MIWLNRYVFHIIPVYFFWKYLAHLLTASIGLFILAEKDIVRIIRIIWPLFLAAVLIWLLSCEGGLEPPLIEDEPYGVIRGTVTYSGQWPPQDSLNDLRFVPLKSVPAAFTDIIMDFQNLSFSDRLAYYTDSDEFFVDEVENGRYIYNVIAHRYGTAFEWRPVGVYSDNRGEIIVTGDTTTIHIHVDFDNLPPFPPE